MATHTQIQDIAHHVDQEVTLKGWVYLRTGKGKLQFIRLRDGTGIIQCVAFRPGACRRLCCAPQAAMIHAA